MKHTFTALLFILMGMQASARYDGAPSPAIGQQMTGTQRTQQYWPEEGAFISNNGQNRFTRALYGGYTDYRIETSDRPIFAVVKKGHYRSVRFTVADVPLESAEQCWSSYADGMRKYVLRDSRLAKVGISVLRVNVVARHDEEGAIWQFVADKYPEALHVKVKLCDIAKPKLKRNGDLGVDDPDSFEPAPDDAGLVEGECSWACNFAHLVLRVDEILPVSDVRAFDIFSEVVRHHRQMAARVQFQTPDPYINTLGGALVMAADGDWDGQTWLHGCVGWRVLLPGWRAAYAGDVLGWSDRARMHFDAYAKSQVTEVEPSVAHPSQDTQLNMARAEKRWGTQMYSNGYICRSPERTDQMHHYDMNLCYIDELLWHFQYDADREYMRQMWPTIKRHLEWEKRNFDPDGDHLYDAYACIWASDALYYNGGAVTHSSAYNYRANLLAARIAELIGEDGMPYAQEAEAILQAMNERLWLPGKGHWVEYEDAMGLKRKHESAAVWSVYTPIDCGACTPEQAFRATMYVDLKIPHFNVCIDSKGEDTLRTIATSNWLPYAWSINNVAPAEVMHTALAYYEAGRSEEAFNLMKANIMDNMYLGQSPANFGQLSHFDAARGECYRDFGDCIGISSRTLIQGLYGVIPQALFGQCIIRPGFPVEWGYAYLKTPYIQYMYTRMTDRDRFEVTQNFAQPLKIIIRQNLGEGKYRDIEGTSERHQIIDVPVASITRVTVHESGDIDADPDAMGLGEPQPKARRWPWQKIFIKQDMTDKFNAEVDDIFKNKYVSPRPQTTTLQIPTQGVGEWCHPEYMPVINDSVFRTLVNGDEFVVAGVPFQTPRQGPNIAFVSLWDNYPDAVTVSLKGKSAAAYLLLAGTTNHMQSHIDNAAVTVTYADGSTETMPLRNPDNWCPIEQDYFIDNLAFKALQPRPYRVSLGTGVVSRHLGRDLGIKGVYGREIPGGAAQMLRMPLNEKKRLKSLTVRALSNDVVIGLMAVTLE